MGNDPPGQFTRVLHPRVGRHGEAPANVIPVGRSVIVPANGSLPNIVLSPRTFGRIRRTLERERFDVLHLHEPMTPAICVITLILARTPMVGTFHASGDLGWMRFGTPVWGFLPERLDHRIAVSERARGVAGALAAGRVRGHPERRARPRVRSCRRTGASRRLRRPSGVAQGAPGAPRRVARHPPPLRVATHRRGSGSARGETSPDATPRTGRRHRHRRLPEPGRADRDPAPVEGARGAVARAGELRHGSHARVRLRPSGRRLGHPGVPGGSRPVGLRLGATG